MADAQTAAPPALRRELGLRDLTFFAITCVVGTRWIPAAAHAGPGSITLWVLASLLFMVPLAMAVASLAVKYPGAGGLYLWARNDFGPWHGFLCFWVYWMGIALWFPSAAMAYMSIAAYTLGPHYAHLAESRTFVVIAALATVWMALGTNLVGVKIGKWTENAGGAATWLLGALVLAVGALVWIARGSATRIHLWPAWNWNTVNFWSQIAYGTTGLELAAMMGDEIHDVRRTLPRAAWITAGFATLFYAGATLALLVVLEPDKISVMHGLAQGGQTAGELLGALWLAPLIAALMLVTALGQFGGIGSATSRLPFAVGADALLPKVFARIHPRWATPHVSILTLGGVATFFLVGIQLGDTLRAAYQALVSLMVIAGFIPYLYIFSSAWKAGRRWSVAAGLGVTALALAVSVVPTADVTSVWLFEAKIAGGTLLVIGSAWLIYRRAAG